MTIKQMWLSEMYERLRNNRYRVFGWLRSNQRSWLNVAVLTLIATIVMMVLAIKQDIVEDPTVSKLTELNETLAQDTDNNQGYNGNFRTKGNCSPIVQNSTNVTIACDENEPDFTNALYWQLIASNSPGEAGRRAAIEALHKNGVELGAIDLSCEKIGREYNYNRHIGVFGGCEGAIDVSGIQLSRSAMDKANFDGSVLSHADFSFASIWEGSFYRTTANKANFRGAHLSGAMFREANLENSNFQEARLGRAVFIGASLKSADFRNAYVDWALFEGAYIAGSNFEGVHFFPRHAEYLVSSDDKPFIWQDDVAPIGLKRSFYAICDAGNQNRMNRPQTKPSECN